MSSVTATFTVDGASFTTKKEATAYAAISSGLDAAGFDADFIKKAMIAYKNGLFQVPKRPRSPNKAQ